MGGPDLPARDGVPLEEVVVKAHDLSNVCVVLTNLVLENEDHLFFVGIDPGAEGAVGVLVDGTCFTTDIPTLKVGKPGGGTKTVFNHPAIIKLFQPLSAVYQRVRVALEVPPPSMGPGERGAMGSFRLGVAYGIWPLYLCSRGFKVEEYPPSVWKKKMGLAGQDKEAARYKALGMFPDADIQRKKDHNRAEALLLAEFHRRQVTTGF